MFREETIASHRHEAIHGWARRSRSASAMLRFPHLKERRTKAFNSIEWSIFNGLSRAICRASTQIPKHPLTNISHNVSINIPRLLILSRRRLSLPSNKEVIKMLVNFQVRIPTPLQCRSPLHEIILNSNLIIPRTLHNEHRPFLLHTRCNWGEIRERAPVCCFDAKREAGAWC